MRLLDMIAQGPHSRVVNNAVGREVDFNGVSEIAGALSECSLRYVLDKPASAQCRDLVLMAREMFAPEDQFLRMPAERFWLEWFCDLESGPEGSTAMSGQRMGAFVDADPSGRSGVIRMFWASPEGPKSTEASLEFDLDRELAVPQGSRTSFRLTHRDFSHLDPLFRRALLKLNPALISFVEMLPPKEFRKVISQVGENMWWCLPLALAFSAMMNSGGLLDERQSSLDRLNAVRAKAKRPPLLEHVEVGMQLGYSRFSIRDARSDAERRGPRLHYVRGHIVRRSGKTFWRSSHLRGDVATPVVSRTVGFGAGRSPRREEASA